MSEPTSLPGVATQRLVTLHADLERCHCCPRMQGPPVHGESVVSPVMLVGQAPGIHEIQQLRPFCWTSGKTLFQWLGSIGLDEDALRARMLISAVCRCFPGKNGKGGDRVPNRLEVANCAGWWRQELELARPRLLIPVGKLAIDQFRDVLPRGARLEDLVSHQWSWRSESGIEADLIPLPHPSGVSTWFKVEPGRTLLPKALSLIADHPAWQALLADSSPPVKGTEAGDRAGRNPTDS